ncbi:flagellar motor switch protein FliG [Aliishimia ponticola]|uniref:Flagellar motor switch protein FliG n=2 Tax=Aliishimia ponticola TaxID=2499833 RepID=A0A4S4NPY2_9RHOB|nr:FliG C-terminal domain-containing protein [Aliishimia ponticola]THH38270.1 flagellar motor switch protein FliG [Aliishimia ponticola]
MTISGRPGARQLSRRAKAAIVVRYLLNNGAEVALEDLPDNLQAILTQQMGAMRLVDKVTVDQVIEEFTAELEAVGLHFPGDIAGALDALDGKISAHTAARLRKEAGVRQAGNPWERIKGLAPERLVPVFEEESPEIAAVILSKLDVGSAAKLLGMLPGPLARQITYAVNQTSSVTPEAVDRIGLSLASQLDAEPILAFDEGPVERVGAILNSSTSATREDVLQGLDETDKMFATEVRKAIFTFANIPTRISPRDLPTVLRGVDQSRLIVALAAAKNAGMEDVTEFIFTNISARLADQMREEMDELDDVKPADGEEAMSEIVGVIRDMEAKGELLLLQVEDDDAE